MSQKNKNHIFYLSLAWLFYSTIVFTFGSCGLQMKMTKNGEYDIFYTITEEDVGEGYNTSYEYEVTYMESLNLNEAEEIINDCIRESETIMKKYGTVYNLKTGEFTLDLFLMLIIFISPYYIIYKFLI